MRLLLYYLWIAPQVIHGVILAVLFWKGLSRKFPLFTAYVVFDLSRFVVLFALWFISRYGSYKWVGTSSEFVATAIELAIVYGLSRESLIGPRMVLSVLRSWIVFVGAGCVLLAAIVSAMLSAVGHARVDYIFYMTDLSSSMILTGTLLALFLFARIFRLAWRSHGFGIALGFGVSQSVFLVVAALRPLLDRHAWLLLDNVDLAAYHVTVVIWLLYFISPQRILQFSGNKLQKTDLESWSRELQGMVH